MITINLKPGVKRAKAGGSLASGLSALKTLPSKVKDPWPMLAIGVWVAVLGFLAWVGIGSATSLNKMETRLIAARSENVRFRALIAERRRAEAAKDSVITQIATIRAVDGDRYVWPHILDEITRAMPTYTWLTEVSTISQQAAVDSSSAAMPTPVGVQLNGRTMDIQGFTRFMRQLEDSPYLADVTLISTTTEIVGNRAVYVFTVKAQYVRQIPTGQGG